MRFIKFKSLFALLAVIAFNSSLWAGEVISSSEYTSLENCKILKKDKSPEALGYIKEQCHGRDGYTLFYESADSRGWLIFQKGKMSIDTRTLSGNIPLHFIDVVLGKLEWRYRLNQGGKKLAAVIYRIFGQDPKTQKDNQQFLHVLRVGPEKWCGLGWASSNEEARKLADSDQKCP